MTSELVWHANTGDWDSTLRAGGKSIGSLRFEASLKRAAGEIDGRKWTFEHHDSIAHPNITIHADGATEPAAIFDYRITGGGAVSFRNGVRYRWTPNFAGSLTFCFRREGEKGRVCVTEEPPSTRGSRVQVCSEAADQPETPVLILLGWFLQVQIYEQFLESLVAW
jgi:hypothetical protein